MLKNYLKTALRTFARFKAFSAVNVFGLSVGMAGCLLILVYVQNEFSFDKNNLNASRIYRLIMERETPEGVSRDITTPPPLAPALANDFPQITRAVRFLSFDNPIPLISYLNKSFYEKYLCFADQNVFKVFTMPFLRGNPAKALEKPNTVVLNMETAKKYFGDEDPVGKTLTLNHSVKLEVTGVIRDSPGNSTLQYSILISFSTLRGWLGSQFVDDWQNNTCQTYVLLSKSTEAETLTAELPRFVDRHFAASSSLKRILLQPFDRIHLYSYQDFGLQSSGDIDQVRLLIAVALFILLIATINFVNLTTARSAARFKEVVVRRTVGATKEQLIFQFVGEGLLLAVLSFLFAVVLVELIMPLFNDVIGRNLHEDFMMKGWFWLTAAGTVIIVGILSSIYPAFIFSAFEPGRTLKRGAGKGHGRLALRKGLVVIQFALTIVLIIGTWIVYRQLSYMQTKNLGFDKSDLVVAPIRDESLRQNPHRIESRLLELPGVVSASGAALMPGGPVGRTRFKANGVAGTMSILWVDQGFIPSLGIRLVAGRSFSPDFPSDSGGAFVLNEEAIKELGWKTPSDAIGKPFNLVGGKKGVVIGVARNFNFLSLQHKIGPVVVTMWPWMNYVLVRVKSNDIPATLASMKKVWTELDPKDPFTFTFLANTFDRFYQPERQLMQVAGGFTALAILIAFLGLFSLASITAAQRTKEIGVRKVLGASASRLSLMLTREFVILVLEANVVAWPASYYVMTHWLHSFAYRTSIGIDVFVASALISVCIAIASVSYQALLAASANPIESLRYE